MDSVQFKLEDFEGPLDLLLYLISKNKMNIYEIEILALIEQYINTIGALTKNSLESASEFIEMAARLVQMKSFFLLPKSEEAERLRAELTGQLIEYSACKAVAAKLKMMAEGVFIVVREPVTVDIDTSYHMTHSAMLLYDAYTALAGRSTRKRSPKQEQFEPITQAPFVTVTSRIVHVLRGLVSGKVKRLKELFSINGSTSQTVATFLAVLELVRAGRITINSGEELSVTKHLKRGMLDKAEDK